MEQSQSERQGEEETTALWVVYWKQSLKMAESDEKAVMVMERGLSLDLQPVELYREKGHKSVRQPGNAWSRP